MKIIGKLIDLKGKKFGKLTVLYKNSHRTEKGKSMTYWHCLCDCGNECEKSSQYLRSNNYISCGKCSPKNIKDNIKDLSGKRFGKLTVLCVDFDKRQEQFINNIEKIKVVIKHIGSVYVIVGMK